jgi:starch synthase
MKKLQVLYIASESVPFSKTGGLADVAGCLPSQLQKLGCDVKVFLPYYKQTKEAAHDINVLRQNLSADLGQWDRDFTLRHVKHGKVDYYFIDKPSLYDRGGLYGEAAHDFSDNSKRFGFFMNAVIASSISLGFSPDIINCNDWQTALLPFYIKFRLQDCPNFRDTKTVFTIHNWLIRGYSQGMRCLDAG